jgi:hypothetical protein
MKRAASGASSNARGKGKKAKADTTSNNETEANNNEEEEEVLEDQDELAEQIEAAMARRGNNIWASGGPAKDAAIRMLIQCFGSMIESTEKEDAIPDHHGRYRPEDKVHKKLLDASKQVVKAKR